MDSGEYLELYPEQQYDDIKRVDQKEATDQSITYDDIESSQVSKVPKVPKVPKAGTGRPKKVRKATEGEVKLDKVYEIPNVYAEIPDTSYETLQPDQRTIELPMSAPSQSSAPSTRPALPGEPQQLVCCRKSTRFWCILTAALSTVIVTMIVVFLTGNVCYK